MLRGLIFISAQLVAKMTPKWTKSWHPQLYPPRQAQGILSINNAIKFEQPVRIFAVPTARRNRDPLNPSVTNNAYFNMAEEIVLWSSTPKYRWPKTKLTKAYH